MRGNGPVFMGTISYVYNQHGPRQDVENPAEHPALSEKEKKWFAPK